MYKFRRDVLFFFLFLRMEGGMRNRLEWDKTIKNKRKGNTFTTKVFKTRVCLKTKLDV